jgi:hypothetical protein
MGTVRKQDYFVAIDAKRSVSSFGVLFESLQDHLLGHSIHLARNIGGGPTHFLPEFHRFRGQ